MAGRTDRRGFTLVEATIVVVVIGVILAVSIPWMRERERARLQALADTEPWQVFEFRAVPTKMMEGRKILVRCEIENLTGFPLTLPTYHSVALADGETNERLIVRSYRNGLPVLPKTAIAPGESVKFQHGFELNRAGKAMFRVWLGWGAHRFQSNTFRVETSKVSELRTCEEIVSAVEKWE